MPSSEAHGHGRPHDRLDVHERVKPLDRQVGDRPVQPLHVHRPGAQLGNADVDVVGEEDAAVERGADGIGRQQAVRPLPHHHHTVRWCRFEVEPVGEEQVRISDDDLVVGLAQRQRIDDLAPARVSRVQPAQALHARVPRGDPVCDLGLVQDIDLGATRYDILRRLVCEDLLLVRIVGDQTKVNRLDGIASIV